MSPILAKYNVVDQNKNGTVFEIFLENADINQAYLHSEILEHHGFTFCGWWKLDNGYTIFVSKRLTIAK